MSEHYILKHKKVAKASLMEWARFFETEERFIKRDTLPNSFVVSTVFLGLNHDFDNKGKPILFETMVFDGDSSEQMIERYSTYREAERGHKRIVKLVLSK